MNCARLALLAALVCITSCTTTPQVQLAVVTRVLARAPGVLITTPAPASANAPTFTPAHTATARPTPAPTRTPRPGQVQWRGDLHMHTTCSDGQNSYQELVTRALELGLDFIAITDHIGHAERDCHNEAILLCEAETRLLCIPGAELTARVHVLAIGVRQRIDPKQPLDFWVKEIHHQGGLAIAAHPYDQRWPYTRADLVHSDLDAMECARGTEDENQQQWKLSEQYNIPCVYNSDAHYQQDVGWRHNVCSVPINTLADLKAALVRKKCEMN